MRPNAKNMTPVVLNNVPCLFYEIGGLKSVDREYLPFFYVVARVDFNDVRTGFRLMVSISKASELHPIGLDLSLVEDMVQDVDPHNVKNVIPEVARLGKLPDFVDTGFMSQMETLFIRHLLNSFKARVYRNFELDIYSSAGESLEDFTARCMDLLNGARRRDQDALHEVFNRKLGQIEQKYLNGGSSDDFEMARTASQGKDVFSNYLERIAGLFLQSKIVPLPPSVERQNSRGNPELGERLLALESEARHAIAELWASYRQKSQSVDEYILHPNLKDIHIVRSCILWMPAGAA